MKLVTDESTITPVVKSLDLEPISSIRYDQNLPAKIDAEILLVREYGAAAVDALSGSNEFDFTQRLKHFRLALKNHLKKTGIKLYVFLRGEFKDDVRGERLAEFEARVTKEVAEIAAVLVNAKKMEWNDREAMKPKLALVVAMVMKIHEQEKTLLHPIYSELAQKYSALDQGGSRRLASAG